MDSKKYALAFLLKDDATSALVLVDTEWKSSPDARELRQPNRLDKESLNEWMIALDNQIQLVHTGAQVDRWLNEKKAGPQLTIHLSRPIGQSG